MVNSLSAAWETQVQSLGWEDPLKKEMATHSSILAWKIPWREESGGATVCRVTNRQTWLSNSTSTFTWPNFKSCMSKPLQCATIWQQCWVWLRAITDLGTVRRRESFSAAPMEFARAILLEIVAIERKTWKRRSVSLPCSKMSKHLWNEWCRWHQAFSGPTPPHRFEAQTSFVVKIWPYWKTLIYVEEQEVIYNI